MKVLVIGGTGWVGHHIALACFRSGYEVEIMSRHPDGRFSDQVTFLSHITGDKTDRDFMGDLLGKGNYDVVIDSVPAPQSIAILSEFQRKFDRYIQCGSVGVYTPLQVLPADENHPFGQKTYEGFEGKIAADRALFDAVNAGKLRGSVLRPSCIAGSGKMPLDNLGGRRDDFITDLRDGKTLDLLDGGTALLQIVHVRDLGRAFALAAGKTAFVNRVCNICGRNAVTVRHYCEIAAKALGTVPHFASLSFDAMIAKYGEEIRGGLTFLAEHMCFSIRRAEEELGWVPEYSVEAAVAENVRLMSQK